MTAFKQSNATQNLSVLDKIISFCEDGLKTVFAEQQALRDYPARGVEEASLTAQERKHSAGLMRVNHAGEVSAQALYRGQALTAKLPNIQKELEQASAEETDHLAWCQQRLNELDSHTSFLNPVWYAGSFCIGAVTGLVGDRWSLGFVAETENQVVQHLGKHLGRLPPEDTKSKKIIEQMKEDEAKHATMALRGGGISLPLPVRVAMSCVSKIMTKTAYRL